MSEKNKHIEFELVGRAQAGDDKAFEELVQLHDRRILNLAPSMLGNLADAQDVYQETFMRAWRGIGSFRHQSSFTTWLMRIAVNQSLTLRRRRSLHSFFSLHDAATTSAALLAFDLTGDSAADKALQSEEMMRQINAALDTLSARERAVFSLKHFQGEKIREIAVMLGCAEGTVKNLLFRGVRKMRKSLHAYFKDEVDVLS